MWLYTGHVRLPYLDLPSVVTATQAVVDAASCSAFSATSCSHDLLADHLRRQLLPPCWQAQTWHAQVSAVSVPLPAAASCHSKLLHFTLRSCTEQCPGFRVPGIGLSESTF